MASSSSSSFSSFSFSSSSSSSSSSSASMGLDAKQLHVLVVDDSLLDRKLTEMLLVKNACKVTTKEDGFKALQFLGLTADEKETTKNNDKINLIISDYHMPGMTGFELLKKIKESPTTKAIPVVILSSEKEANRVDECMKEGAHQFIQKPLKQSAVAQLLCMGDKGPQ